MPITREQLKDGALYRVDTNVYNNLPNFEKGKLVKWFASADDGSIAPPFFRQDCSKEYKGRGYKDYIFIRLNDLSMPEKTLFDLEVGEVLETDSLGLAPRKVGRVLAPGLYVMHFISGTFLCLMCAEELEGLGFKLKVEPEVQEMTVADVEKLVGKKVKIIK